MPSERWRSTAGWRDSKETLNFAVLNFAVLNFAVLNFAVLNRSVLNRSVLKNIRPIIFVWVVHP